MSDLQHVHPCENEGKAREIDRNKEMENRKEVRTRDGGGSKSKSDGGWGVGGGPVGVPCANMIDNGMRACVCVYIRYACICMRIRLMKLSVTAIRHTKTSVVVTVIKRAKDGPLFICMHERITTRCVCEACN